MALTNDDLFVVQDPTDNKFYKLTLGELVQKTDETVHDGAINFNAGNGLSQTGDNASANQLADTTKTFSVLANGSSIGVSASGIKVEEIDGGVYAS